MKSDFAIMCRELRIQHNLKQREVAERIGVKPSTYGNVESSAFKVIRAERVAKLIALYRLPPDRASAFSAAFERCPLSPYGEKQRKTWDRRNKMRSKAKNHDNLQYWLCIVAGTIVTFFDEPCACPKDDESFGGGQDDDPCEVCGSMLALGLDSYTTKPAALEQLSALQAKLEAARAAQSQGAA